RAGSAGLRNRAPVVLVTRERTPAVADRRLVEAQIALLVAGRPRHADAIVREGVAVDARDLRRDRPPLQAARQVVARSVVHRLDAEAGGQGRSVELTRGRAVYT